MLKQLGIALALVGLGAAVGHYTLPAKVVIKRETVIKRQYLDKSTIVRTETRKPDGTDVVVTETKRDVEAKRDLNSHTEETRLYDTQRWQVGALAAIRPLKGEAPTYGAEVSYRLLGPITVGGFGLLNGEFGASVGLRF